MKTIFFSLIATLAFAASSISAQADVLWQWSFGTESGLLRTDGTEADTAGTYTFTIIDFELLDSGQGIDTGSLSGGQFSERVPPQGFVWNGTGAIQFFRDGGNQVTGAFFSSTSNTNYMYVFLPNEGSDANVSMLKTATYPPQVPTQGLLNLRPILNTAFTRPDIRIGKNEAPGTHLGNDIYNKNAIGQRLKLRIPRRSRTEFYVSAESDSDVPDSIVVLASQPRRNFRTRHYSKENEAWKNRTAILVTTGYIISETATSPTEFRTRTRSLSRKKRARQVLKYLAQSIDTPSAKDQAKAVVIWRG